MLKIEEPAPSARQGGIALFALGFRPFYLLAALYAALAVLAWTAMFEGRIGAAGPLPPALWHQHEMLYGFALAVIAGFLLTAGRVWTGLPTPSGFALALLAGHWILARVLLVAGGSLAAAIVDSAFPFVLAAVMGRVIVASRSRRNYFVVLLLVVLGVADVMFHLGAAGIAGWPPQPALKGALYLVLTLVVVMSGRVVPAFTAGALPAAKVMLRPRLDRAALVATLTAFGLDLYGAHAVLVAPAALAAALLHGWRQAGWAPLATLGRPLLWSLHAGHAWLSIGFLLLALARLGIVAPAVPVHAFAVGAMGGMIIAMITRTALGHTGRPLVAGRSETAAYLLVHAAALLRVGAALVPGAAYVPLLALSGLAWSAAFLLYFAVYLPRLLRPRLDGRPG